MQVLEWWRGFKLKFMKVEEFYNKVLGINEPFKYQREVWKKIRNLIFPLLIKAPTGSGKTEAVLAPFLNQFVEKRFPIAPRLIYVLPMRVLVNDIAKRIEEYANKISHSIKVKIQHGDVSNSPFFMGDIVVTTLDQFIYGFARASKQVGRHVDIPAGCIASSLIIFDEAHMYRDPFTFSVMRAVLEILNYCNIPFVIMTATMPKSLKESLFENIQCFEEVISNETKHTNIEWYVHNESLFKETENGNVEVNLSNDLVEKIFNKRALIVVNQVRKAQKLYDFINQYSDNNNDVLLIHSRFTVEDKRNKEEKIKRMLDEKEKCVIISTQVLEAGIDISAELLITELAPADALIQRIGRCARREGERGEVHIFSVEDEKPYQKEVIDKTREWLLNNRNANLKDFNTICSFVDETLNYEANDIEARDTLIDLYECTLYADTMPSNMQVRESKPVYLVVLNSGEAELKKSKQKYKGSIEIKPHVNLRDRFIEVDTKIAWWLKNKGLIQYRIFYEQENENEQGNGKWRLEEARDIIPFSIYLLKEGSYNQEKGISDDACEFI